MMDTSNKSTKKKKNRRPAGVPASVTALVVIAALVMGCIGGYLVGILTSDAGILRQQLEQQQFAVAELQAQLYLLTGDDQYAQGAQEFSGWGESDNNQYLAGETDTWGWGSGESVPATPVAVIEFNGGSIMSDVVLAQYERVLSEYTLMGYSLADLPQDLLTDVMQAMAEDAILLQKATELGCLEITEQDEQQLHTQAHEEYHWLLQFYMENNGATVEEQQANAEAQLAEQGITEEGILEDLKAEFWREKLYALVTEEAIVTDEQLESYYQQQMAQQKADYDEYIEYFEYDYAAGTPIMYYPNGYRGIRQIFIAFTDAQAAEYSHIMEHLENPEDQADKATLQEELNKLFAPLEEKAQKAIDMMQQEGATFTQAAKAWGSEGSSNAEDGPLYAVSSNSTTWPQEFVQAAMAIENIGYNSAMVRSHMGVHIIQYAVDLPEGEVPLGSVRDILHQQVLAQNRAVLYGEKVKTWVAEANVVYHPELL